MTKSPVINPLSWLWLLTGDRFADLYVTGLILLVVLALVLKPNVNP